MSDIETTPDPDGDRPPGGAVVTGAAEGIGFQIARALAERGHPVHLTDLDGAAATRAAAELGPPAFASGLDVRSLTACRAAAARTRRRVGSLEVWVNGTLIPSTQPAWELDERARQRMLEVNLLGTINGTLAAVEQLRSLDGGSVVNVIRMAGLLPTPGHALLAAGSQAAMAFSLATEADLRQEGVDAVSVSCLCVGRGGIRSAGLYQLLDHPRPMVAIPPWRGTVVRASYLWPKLAPLGSRLVPDRSRDGSRRRRRRRS
ncbi:MAG TPA: SDR family NAD(P)-dependent oxidoreductase [Solirubrobacteraceae bacterium]|jgi:NAD(P)-dependent dehydrogenase (short-subunit alcohol dehydrogenase family)